MCLRDFGQAKDCKGRANQQGGADEQRCTGQKNPHLRRLDAVMENYRARRKITELAETYHDLIRDRHLASLSGAFDCFLAGTAISRQPDFILWALAAL